MGPESAKSFRGKRLLRPSADADAPAPRATQEIDYGRRGSGYIFGAFRPATGAALTAPYDRRTTANFIAFLEQVEAWLPAEAERVYAVLDNLSTHRAPDVLLFALAYPRWEFVYQPVYAAWLNLIESWWKTLRSLALTGRRFATWDGSATRYGRPPPTGTRTSTPSSGAAADGIAPAASPASPSVPMCAPLSSTLALL
jgi:transposase